MDNSKAFLNVITPIAVKYGDRFDILPSVIIANAILESSWNTTKESQLARNIYKLRVDKSWNGKCYSVVTGKTYPTRSKSGESDSNLIRFYNNYDECILDYVSYITSVRRSNGGPLLYDNIVNDKDYKSVLDKLYYRDGYLQYHLKKQYADKSYLNTAMDIIVKNKLNDIDTEIDKYMEEYGMAKKQQTTPKTEPKKPIVLYRVRKSWEDQESQLLTTRSEQDAVQEASKHPGYRVYVGEEGRLFLDPWDERTAKQIEKEKKEIHFHPGKKITLSQCPLYRTYTDTKHVLKISGTFYMYNAHPINNRIRISKTNDPNRINGKDITAILGCVDIAYIK